MQSLDSVIESVAEHALQQLETSESTLAEDVPDHIKEIQNKFLMSKLDEISDDFPEHVDRFIKSKKKTLKVRWSIDRLIKRNFGPAPFYVPLNYQPPPTWREYARRNPDVYENEKLTYGLDNNPRLTIEEKRSVIAHRQQQTRDVYQAWLHRQWVKDGSPMTEANQVRLYKKMSSTIEEEE